MLTIAKWVIGLMVPILAGLGLAIRVLWHRLAERSREYAEVIAQKDAEKDELQREWREAVERVAADHKAEMKELWARTDELAREIVQAVQTRPTTRRQQRDP